MSTKRYYFHLAPLMKPILLPFGATRERSWAEISDEGLRVQFGHLFDQAFPRGQIESAERSSWFWLYGLGVRLGTGGRIGVIGSTENVVRVRFREPQFIHAVFGLHVKGKELYLALEEPDAFVADLRGRIGAPA